ncbi:uncharacterized protein LTR77_007521 [Saxophila tyrrhenica]|uniref:Uncharacterized protein n=1 Tax=Saxophila tyrrhenica TaxID=1690608 RepID=A0AAV9P8Q0_9PEZI|nr:hypothetical protein LTR77_007521 [Saxophila tyrrhenica]
MAPSKYLIRTLSKPTKVDESLWEKWYTEEHTPDAVNSGVGDRGAFFRAHNEFSLQTKTPLESGETKLHGAQLSHFNELPADKTFCAVYQTKFENYTESEEIKKTAKTSEMFGGKEFFPLAEWDVRVYELIQDYNPDNLPDTAPPFTLHVQNEPASDADYHDFYENEHLDLLHKVPGYRRSQRYKLVHNIMGAPEGTPRFLVIHEWDHLDALDGPELRAADSSPNVHRVFGTAKAVNVRGFRKVYDQGYEE